MRELSQRAIIELEVAGCGDKLAQFVMEFFDCESMEIGMRHLLRGRKYVLRHPAQLQCGFVADLIEQMDRLLLAEIASALAYRSHFPQYRRVLIAGFFLRFRDVLEDVFEHLELPMDLP